MKYPHEIKKFHENIQKKLFFMLPEKWDRIYLYASVIDMVDKSQSGEMFFYYYPKGILKKKPVNVYEVPSKFNIDENEYFKLANELYTEIKKLRDICTENKEEIWSNVTIAIEDLKYKAIYGYEDLNSSDFNIEERRLIWTYRYLKLPYASLNKQEKEVIDMYKKKARKRETVFELPLYTKTINKDIESIKDITKKLEFVTEDKIEEMKFKETHIPKSQILNTK